MKICIILWNLQNLTISSQIFPRFFTPVMHCQWQGVNTALRALRSLGTGMTGSPMLGSHFRMHPFGKQTETQPLMRHVVEHIPVVNMILV